MKALIFGIAWVGVGAALATRRRAASRVMLQSALDRVRVERQSAIAAVEEAATRLLLAREDGERGEVQALLMALRARLVAGEEVEASVRAKAS